jgi:hypothetical protein
MAHAPPWTRSVGSCVAGDVTELMVEHLGERRNGCQENGLG